MNNSTQLKIETMSARTFETLATRIHFEKNGCWIWTGAKINGYGFIRYKGKVQLVHRLLYAWFVKPIPMGYNPEYQLDHICCNPSCCNPKHLQLVTQTVNVLKGNGPTAKNAKKTHCIHGHLLPIKPNTTDGHRRCIICQRERDRKYWAKRRKHYVRHIPSIK